MPSLRKPCKGCGGKTQLKPDLEIVPGLRDPMPDAPPGPWSPEWADDPEVMRRHIAHFRWLLRQQIPPAATRPGGDGIVIVAGGRYAPMAAVSARMCRDVCDLPIQIWHRGKADPFEQALVADLAGVTIHDAAATPSRQSGAWQTKRHALLHCGLARALFLDADAYAVADPSPLLELAGRHRFVWWEDMANPNQPTRWDGYGLEAGKVGPVQGGQFAIDLVGFRRELVISKWCDDHSEYFYRKGYGDQAQWQAVLTATGGGHLCLGKAPWQKPAFVLPLNGRPIIVHRPQGKMFAYPHLPGEAKAWRYFAQAVGDP